MKNFMRNLFENIAVKVVEFGMYYVVAAVMAYSMKFIICIIGDIIL